jgi:isoleucyl-tRNA synthetase
LFEPVPTTPELSKGEEEVLAYWGDASVFKKLQEKVAGKPTWSFLDGPITANNPMGVHHAWGRTYKDAFQRYFAMTGHDERFQNGFDCQGLWVEVEVEKELGFKSKTDIEAFGLEKFINACKERVIKYSGIQTEQSIRLGMWMDWDNSYFTMSDENNYTIWSFLKKCHGRGLIYKGLDSMPWCPRCGTGISEQERREGYKLIEDEAVYVRFPLRSANPSEQNRSANPSEQNRESEDESLLIWTTTPWTLAANVAAAINPDLTYVKARYGGHIYYLTKGRLDVLEGAEVLEELPGRAMIGWTYDGPFDDLPGAADAAPVHRVIEWDEVGGDEGSGIVHIAPGAGKEDFDLGKSLGLPVIAPLDDAGVYEDGFGFLTGKFAGAATEEIYADLSKKDLFVKREKYVHDYPHCWRCSTKLLFRAVDEWFINMSWRDEIKALVPQIRWVPDYGESQELDWLNNMGDWMISKKRYWGLALPIWECSSCNAFEVVGGREELQERAVEGWDEFDGHSPHRPWIDSVKLSCAECGGQMSRVPEVGNPWLDAGIVTYSTVFYNTDREEWAKWIPADFVVESFPGQFRNWFYSLLAMSAMMEGIPPFKTLFGYALMRDEKGEEMHKSKGNAIDYNDAVQTVSADSMRWLFCRHTPTINLNFGFGACKDIERKMFGTLWNTFAFLVNYARLDGFDPQEPPVPVNERPDIDRWVLSELQGLVADARRGFEGYWISPAVRKSEEFIDDVSNWYVRRNRRRFWRSRGDDDRDKLAAYQTLYEVLTTLIKVLAPVVPFLTERIYSKLRLEEDPESVHLCDFPEIQENIVDERLSTDMRLLRDVVTEALALRSSAGIRVRQPLAELRVAIADSEQRSGLQDLVSHLTDEINVKRVELVDSLDVGQDGWLGGQVGEIAVSLDGRITPELRREGLARDAVRHIQKLRRDAGLDMADRIEVGFSTEDDEIAQSIVEWGDYIRTETLATTLARDTVRDGQSSEVKIDSRPVRFSLRKA